LASKPRIRASSRRSKHTIVTDGQGVPLVIETNPQQPLAVRLITRFIDVGLGDIIDHAITKT
jgi:hypothetical protein